MFDSLEAEEKMEKPHDMEDAKKKTPPIENTPRLPVRPKKRTVPYDNPENLSEIEEAIIRLSEEISNLTDFREGIEQLFSEKQSDDKQRENLVTKYYNSLQQKFTNLNDRLTTEIDYRNELEERVRSANYSREVYLLEQELDKERAKISLFVDELSSSTKETLGRISDKIVEMKGAEQLIKEATLKFRSDASQCTQSEFEVLKNSGVTQMKGIAESAQSSIDSVKKSATAFLAQCDKENKELIKKIPRVKEKLGFENWLTIGMGALGFASLFIRIVLG